MKQELLDAEAVSLEKSLHGCNSGPARITLVTGIALKNKGEQPRTSGY